MPPPCAHLMGGTAGPGRQDGFPVWWLGLRDVPTVRGVGEQGCGGSALVARERDRGEARPNSAASREEGENGAVI